MTLKASILILEDDDNRIDRFRKAYGDKEQYDLNIVKKASEAIELLESQTWTFVSLDHDLGGEVYVDTGREDCGMEVVRWLEANKDKVNIKWPIVVHSFNTVAAKEMVVRLKAADYNSRWHRFPMGLP